MPATTNKQRLLNGVFTNLKKRYDPGQRQAQPILEEFVYAICRDGTTRDHADRAFRNLREQFFDWNEVRVSSIREVQEAFGELPDAEERAQRIISFLQEVFETTFSFDLEPLHKKGVKQAAKQLARYQAANDFAVSWVTQQTLGGHAVPVDPPTLRVLRRLGLADHEQEDGEALRASLEHLIPKAKAPLFNELISALADDLCAEDAPQCAACPLAGECLTGQEAGMVTSAARSSRPKSR